MKTRQETEIRNADSHGVIADRIVDRSVVANDALAPVVLANLMSTAPVCAPRKQAFPPASPESIARQRETPVEELLSDPMMAALWRAYAISEQDVRRLVVEVTERLKSHGELHRRAEALVARCA